MDFDWELIFINSTETECTYRSKTIGGWIVRHESPEGFGGILFIKDISHSWKIDALSTE